MVNRYERFTYDLGGSFSELALLLKGVREHKEKTFDEEQKLAYLLGINVAGPLIALFTESILDWSKKDSIDRLWLLSRDGQVILKTLEQYKRRGRSIPEFSYLYVSRVAMRKATMAEQAETFDWLFEGSADLNLNTIFNRLGLNPSDWGDWLKRQGCKDEVWLGAPSNELKARLKEWLKAGDLCVAVRQIGRKQNKLAREYIKSTVNSKGQTAYCDIGWTGRLISKLESIVEQSDVQQNGNKAYMLGYRPSMNAMSMSHRSLFHTNDCAFNQQGYCEILEMFFSADHGGVTSYEEENNVVRAVFSQPHNTEALTWGLEAMREGIKDFCDCFANIFPEPEKNNATVYLKLIAFNNFKELMGRPTKSEARKIGAFPVSIDSTHNHFFSLCPSISIVEACKYIFRKNLMPRFWLQGLRHNSSYAVYVVISTSEKLRNALLDFYRYTKSFSRNQ